MVLTTNRLTLTFGARGASEGCEPRDSKRALRLLADSMLAWSPLPWAMSISATWWLVAFPSVVSHCSNFALRVFARAAFCDCFRNSSSTWNQDNSLNMTGKLLKCSNHSSMLNFMGRRGRAYLWVGVKIWNDQI